MHVTESCRFHKLPDASSLQQERYMYLQLSTATATDGDAGRKKWTLAWLRPLPGLTAPSSTKRDLSHYESTARDVHFEPSRFAWVPSV
ncbi:hypothetical protein BaRGS_00000396 [Batillaria attramentaria]|uniref:Uncharacterized protein n=1 Tax=Batillaria attramentaria TaxID=370345 RepID=A0ABD0M8V0_9CAEN